MSTSSGGHWVYGVMSPDGSEVFGSFSAFHYEPFLSVVDVKDAFGHLLEDEDPAERWELVRRWVPDPNAWEPVPASAGSDEK